MFPIILRTLFFYIVVLVMMRVMGKREIGNLSPFDLVVSIMIAELAALPIENIDKPLLEGVLPLAVLLAAEVGIAYLSLKSEPVRKLINGTPSIVISKGRIMENEMRRMRYNINDLLVGLRTQGVIDLSDVEYAVLETSGTLSIIPVANKRCVTPGDLGLDVEYDDLPIPLITDSRMHWDNITGAGWTKAQFRIVLSENGITDPQEVLFAYLDSKGRFKYQYRTSENRQY